tara:strand:+ start:456 stop:1316 length:861 start_codon:yes stop_codon:yes gene_type:complete
LSNTTLQGWGRGTWGQGPWNEHINVIIDSTSPVQILGTTALGTPDGIPGVNVAVTGLSATTAISQTGASTVTYTVTVVSGNPSNHPYYNQGSTNKYAIGGSTASADVNLTLYEGNTYRFDQSDSSNDGHPLRIYQTADKSLGEYTTGVTTNGTPGQAGAYTEITVADGAPRLFYQCSNHAFMGATITTHGIPNIDAATGAPVSANTPVSIAMTTALGNETIVTAIEIAPPDYNNRLSALQSSINDVVIIPQCVVSLTGVSATGSTGEELVYSLIVPNQTANWQEVA